MPTKKNKIMPPAVEQNFPVVGIGASAGGLDAFKRLLKAIPEDSGMAYVLVQHLDPSHESILPEILSRTTKIPVHEITDDIKLAPDHIYIIPSAKSLTSTDGVLKLTKRDRKIQNLPIDVFFTSLAEVHTSFAVGVVLSGTGSDGTLGLKAVKEHGGITFAQDSESAAYDSMPQSAVNAGVVDFILSPEKIPAQLLQIGKTYRTAHALTGDTGAENGQAIPKDDEDVFKQILLLLRQRSSVDFTYYKQPTLRRRIARRMAIGKTKVLTEYLKLLRNDKTEQDALFGDMLISVTSFLRDPKTFETVCNTVFPALFKNKPHDEPLRIWIAGCSTGEEAYSLAICLHEFLGDKFSYRKVQIFASDISEAAIKKARTGIYSKTDVQKFSAEQLKRYFTKNNGEYEVNKIIRDMCVFAPHNFLKDPPFAKMDLISCRNVLIYMDTFLQKKALTTFHYALKENGILMLGKSETIGGSSDLFAQFAKHDKIYSRKPVPGRFIHVATERKEEFLATKDRAVTRRETIRNDYRKSAEEILLTKFTPASVVVNEQLDVVHIHGSITPFLKAPQGKPTYSILKMAREGLAFELRNALHKAKTSGASVRKDNIPVKITGTPALVTIEVIPLTDTVEAYYLILFTKTFLPAADEKGKSISSVKNRNDDGQRHIDRLEKELAHTREDMRSITEDMEAANEELQSANEELQSSNEEMQSLNEELETSKEELQSTNEELTIVNQELLDKQEQLHAARYYSDSIISTLREPLIVLDRSLCIKTANASFYKKFNVEEQDTENNYFYEIQNGQWDDHLMRSLLEKILPRKERLVDFEISLTFPSLGERHLLMNALQIVNEKTAEQLILLAIEDITDRYVAEKKLEETREVLKEKNRLIEENEKRLEHFSHELEIKVNERTAELLASNEELKQMNMHLDQFAHVASHDLQEPLRKITTFSKRLQEKHKDGLNPEIKTYLNKIEGASNRMSTLIQDLLNYSRLLQRDKLFAPTDLSEILKNILSDFELLIQEKKTKLLFEDLPTVSAIPLQMNQLFYNLIGNALKFSRDGVPPRITITSHMLSEKDLAKHPNLDPHVSYCEIIFKDNGIGFEQRYSEKIFTIFQRLHSNDAYIGNGIGLALSKKIIETHHGEIYAKSQENKGTAFHVLLPLEQPDM
ncbi:MAG: chemotaxis protein CheB [Ignavibacteriota bacterium]